MLIAEELFLLLRRDDGRPASATAQRGYGLAAALITDLVVAGRVTLSDDKDPRMTVLDARPAGHPALDAALARLVQRNGKKLSSLITDGKVAAERAIANALAAAGVVDIDEKRAWGLLPASYPVRDPGPERRVRERLRVVLQGGPPQPEDSTLLAVLQGLGVARKLLADEAGTLSRRELKRRITEVSSDAVAGEAVAKAIRSMNAAVTAAAGAAAAGAASS